MPALSYQIFAGENRALHPKKLPAGVGVSSLNQKPGRGDLRPWKQPLEVATVPAGRQTIYRFGRDVTSDANYWFSWTTVVHAVKGFIADDTTERTYYTGDGVPKVTDNTMALAAAPYPSAARILGVPAPISAVTLTAVGGVATINESLYYTYTYVTDKGEESAPGPVSAELVLKTDATVNIASIAAPPSGNYGINRIRIYRTQTGLSGDAEFFFLREIASTLNATTDDRRALGEVIPSDGWLVPPADLHDLTPMWNGMLAGITVNSVRFCVAYKPYAWPIAQEVLPPDAKPVALAVYGQQMLVLTTGRPVLVTGSTPDALDQQPLEFNQACVSSRSAVGMGHGAVWACPDGLAYYGQAGAKLLTAGLMTRDDWQAVKPETIVGGIYEGMYFGTYEVAGVKKAFLIDPLNPAGLYSLDVGYTATFFDHLQDQLYVLDGASVKKWDAGATAMTATFKSGVTVTPFLSLSCAKVIADTYPCTVKFWSQGVLAHTQVVADAKPFRLPTGFRGTDWQVEVSTANPVQALMLGSSMKDLTP